MGLLDSLFDPSTYGGQQGGLLGLLQSPLFQASAQPTQGFPPVQQGASFADRFNALPNAPQPANTPGRQFDAATFDPSTYAPNQAQPIGVGGYQMPRLGSADLFQSQTPTDVSAQSRQPDPATLPPNSQPTQGGPLPAVQSQQAQLPPALGGNPFGGAGLQNFLNTPGGLLQKVVGGIGGAVTGQRTDPQGIQQQNLAAQYHATRQALIANGIPEAQANSTAMLAVLNPEAAKTVLPELLTGKQKYQVVSEDPLTGKRYGFVDNINQTVDGKPINAGPANGGTPTSQSGLQGVIDNISTLRAQGASKEQLLAAIPNGYRDDVEALVNGKAVPANMGRAALRGPLNILAHAVDGNYDETQIPGRIQMRKDFIGEGKNGQAIAAFNTAQHHIDKLSDDLETLAKFHGNYPAINSMKDWFSAKANTNPQLRDTLQSVKTDMAAVSHEIGNAYNAGHLSDHDMATWNALTNSDLPPDQLRRGVADFVDLLNGKRDSLNHMYRQQFNQDAPSIESDKNEAITKKVHQRSPQYSDSSQSSGLPSGWSVTVR